MNPAPGSVWDQLYDPLGSVPLSTLLAALPLVVLLGLLAGCGWPAWRAVPLTTLRS